MLSKPAFGGGEHFMQSTFLGPTPHFSSSDDLLPVAIPSV
jgi:hypothetical protein